MKKLVVCFTFVIVATIGLAAGDGAIRTFHGEVADSQCSMNIHSLTRSHEEMLKSKSMGGSAASCTLYCILYLGGEFVLASKKEVYYLDGVSAQDFAGQQVKVTGTLDLKTRTIHATKIEVEQ